MKNNILKRITAITLASTLLWTPLSTQAALLRQGNRGNEVVQIQTELKKLGYFQYHTATGYFGPITTSAVRHFQAAKGLKVDGIVGPATKSALLGNQETPSSDIQGALDWWSQVQYIFPRGADALVTDVDTGKSFSIRRTFGTNHADIEPLTQKDTDIIKSIWNGFSWERRAVVVSIGNYKLAGSMTAMPHAGVDAAPGLATVNNRSGGYGRGTNLDLVKNNGINGHMDIHFLNSRTHGTNVMQKVHQDMVKKAAQYIAQKNK
ncbi:MAG: hypothetical protein GX347_05140 [Epulopiscium sp.]|nr:hypothetical protein [Candidatus Epulonipiscium sp.]